MNDASISQTLAQAEDHCRAGRFHEAAALYQELLRHPAQRAQAHERLGEIAIVDRRLDLAEMHFSAARTADPSLAKADYNLALVYLDTKRPALAVELLRSVSARVTEVPEIWLSLGIALGQLEEYESAIQAYETALRLRPNYAQAFRNLAMLHLLMVRWDRALPCLRMAAESSSTPADLSNYVLLSMFAPDISPGQVASMAESWDVRFGTPLRAQSFDTRFVVRDPDRPLRIGYVSPAFCHHANGLFSEVFISRHNRGQFLPYCYSDVAVPDEVTERFRRQAFVYRETAGLADEQLAHLIHQDGIDILVDLNAHMKGSRLAMFARRPAPVQITYLAYPFTTGLRSLDYRITDPLLDPPVQAPLGPEALLRLRASFWLYRPNPLAPEPARRLPARSAGRFTFANLNYTQKLNPAVAAAWAAILQQLPNARLLLLAASPAGQKPHLARLFGDAGLDLTRVDIVGPATHSQNLARYLQVDLCLDPFPYGGHTTTLDAVWMGVPVVTLTGSAGYMRGAASILARVGLGELVAYTVEDYQHLAVALARDRSRLEALRLDLRGRMRQSVLCDESGWMADYERGLRLAWRRFCEGLPPADIDLCEEA